MGPPTAVDELFQKDENQMKDYMDKSIQESKLDGSGMKKIEKGKGKFYDAYKEEIDAHAEGLSGGGEAFVKFFKQFDYQEGTFNCSGLDFFCSINDFLYQMGRAIFAAFLKPITTMALKPSTVMDDLLLKNYRSAFSQISKSILLALMAFQILKTIAMKMTDVYGAGQVTNQKLVLFIFSAFLLAVYDTLFELFLNLQYAFTYPLLSGIGVNNDLSKSISVTLLFNSGGFLVGIILILVIALLVLVLTISLYYSMALISIIYVVGPAAIPTMLNEEYDFFSLWAKTLVSRILTIGLQGLGVVLGLKRIATFTLDPNVLMGNALAGIAFLLVAISMPTLLGQFGSSSGGGRMIMGGFKNATRYLTYRR